MQKVNCYREYTSREYHNTMMDACLGSFFGFLGGMETEMAPISRSEYIQKGIYAFTFLQYGSPVTVVIDDYLPTKGYVPIYCKNRSGALWQSFMEKAWAKLNGGYDSIQGFNFPRGTSLTPADLMTNFLHAPAFEYDLCNADKRFLTRKEVTEKFGNPM
jgi:hypothetical protein